jgi:hypothetical protein
VPIIAAIAAMNSSRNSSLRWSARIRDCGQALVILTAGRRVNSLQGSRSVVIYPRYSSVYQALMIARPRLPLTYTKLAPISAAGSHHKLDRHHADPERRF